MSNKRSEGLPWEQAGWLEEATGWIHSQLARNGLEAVGPVELLHQRAWSTFARLAHPFFSLLVTLRAAAYRLKLPEDGPEILRLRDAYLEPWTKSVPKKQLLSAFDLAYHLGMANRALSWHRGLESLAWKHVEPYADSVSGRLQDFLNYPGEGG